MDVRPEPISPHDLYAKLGTATAPVLLDVRRQDAFDADDVLIVGAIRQAPENISRWQNEPRPVATVVVYCVYGQEVSQAMASATLSNLDNACPIRIEIVGSGLSSSSVWA